MTFGRYIDVSLVASFALLLHSGTNDATRAINKLHTRQKS